MDYIEFLKSKEIVAAPSGFEPTGTNNRLFGWQSDVVRWALLKGKACIFADCGLGKTPMQLQWAVQVAQHTGKPTLIFAPLSVAQQTAREGLKFGISVTVCRKREDVNPGVNVTNYEMLEHFDAEGFGGIVLDESSIMKSYDGNTRRLITDAFEHTPYKLCCTATPAPNDYMELGTHSEFLGVMTQAEMLATFFCHDGGNTSKWRLKGHAKEKFFEWVSSWALCMTSPADLGYPADNYQLPSLSVQEIVVKSGDLENDEGQMLLIPEATQTISERRAARRNSLDDRVKAAADIANGTDEQVLVWCDLNAESEALAEAIHGAVEVRGSNTPEEKSEAMNGFTDGKYRVMVSKPSIAGWGMNWQQCHVVVFVGLSDSFEAYYQAVRRCYRFGQTKPVQVYIIISDAECAVKDNIERKRLDAEYMTAELVRYTKDILQAEIHHTVRMSDTYITTMKMEVPEWLLMQSA